jgi:hypothetical protein
VYEIYTKEWRERPAAGADGRRWWLGRYTRERMVVDDEKGGAQAAPVCSNVRVRKEKMIATNRYDRRDPRINVASDEPTAGKK